MSTLEQFIRSARVLIIEDEPVNVLLLKRHFEDRGQPNVCSTSDSRNALPLFSEFQPDLILLDWMMPHYDGAAVLEQIRSIVAPDAYLPIIVLTADISRNTRQRALAGGARDFLLKPFDTDELDLRVRNLLEARFLHLGLQAQNTALESRVSVRTRELDAALRELRESQRQALQQERLHAFATMAAGVVHDFNNSLTIVLGFTEMLQLPGALDDEGKALRDLELISRSAQEAAQVVDRLRQCYQPRIQEEAYGSVDLAKLAEDVRNLARPRWHDEPLSSGRSIEFRLDVPKDLSVRGQSGDLREALLNLVFNAIDAMPGEGTITIQARAADKDKVALSVTDTGLGMSEDVQRRCLEPFFTTKGESGTGLGLAMVFRVVSRHEGDVQIDSRIGRGSTFTITLPREHSASAQEQFLKASDLRPLRVLLAEDDASVREVMAHALAAYGHSVTTACDGQEALECCQEGQFDVVVTDLSMPRMTGTQLGAHLAKLIPHPPVVLLTGFGSMLLPDGVTPPGIDVLLEKPITPAALAAALSRAMTLAQSQSASIKPD